MKHNHVLHERIVFLKVEVENIPFVPQSERLTIEKLGKGFFTIEMRFGFFERQNVPAALATIRNFGLSLDMESTTFFIRRDTLVRSSHPTMRSWQTIIFMKMYASALDAARFFGLPPGRVVELGAQTEI
jgi:KUP system potassium uptake protein